MRTLFYAVLALAVGGGNLHVFGMQTVGLKTLILSSNKDAEIVPTQMLDAYGAPYDVVRVGRYNLGGSKINWYDSEGRAKYNSIVLTDYELKYHDVDANLWRRGLNDKEYNELFQYTKDNDVRIVSLNSAPTFDPALSMTGSTNEHGKLSFTDDKDTKQLLSNVPQDVELYLGGDNKYMDLVKLHWYKVSVDPEQNKRNHLRPFMHIASKDGDDKNKTKYTGALIRDTAFTQEMHFFFSAGLFTITGSTMSDVWFPWVTKGIFLGERRLAITPHIDDVFISTNLYKAAPDAKPFRITGADWNKYVNFQNNLNAMMNNSNITTEMAFNGKGFDAGLASTAGTLEKATFDNRDKFVWVSHTWSHADLYCMNSVCISPSPLQNKYQDYCTNNSYEKLCFDDGLTRKLNDYTKVREVPYPTKGFTPYKVTKREITLNQWFANNILFHDKSLDDILNGKTTFSPDSIVTPRISGLNYTKTLEVLHEVGIKTAVGDNSREDLKPLNIFRSFDSRPTVGNDKIDTNDVKIIPRYPTRIYFSCATPEDEVKLHNDVFATAETSYTWEDMLLIEGYENARNILHYRHDPYMFHQANIAFYNDKINGCLLCEWLTSVTQEVRKYNSLPIYSYKMDDLRVIYDNKEKIDKCDLEGYVTYDDKGAPREFEFTSNGECNARLSMVDTLLKPETKEYMNLHHTQTNGKNAKINFEQNGPDKIYWMPRTLGIKVPMSKVVSRQGVAFHGVGYSIEVLDDDLAKKPAVTTTTTTPTEEEEQQVIQPRIIITQEDQTPDSNNAGCTTGATISSAIMAGVVGLFVVAM